jgi:RNA recognition motif-containing protein
LETSSPQIAHSKTIGFTPLSHFHEEMEHSDFSSDSDSRISISSLEGSKCSQPEKFREIQMKALELMVRDEQRTTLMIRNIPNKYTMEWLLSEVQEMSIQLQFLHVPKAKKSEANLGYAFVDFATPQAALNFMNQFEGWSWPKQPKTTKRATVDFAKLQGLEENIKFYNNPEIAAKLTRFPWVCPYLSA